MTNREIDALVAEKLFNLVRVLVRDRAANTVSPTEYFRPAGNRDAQFIVLPYYSTDPVASKQLRDRMRELGWLFSIQTNLRSFTAYCFLPSETPHDSAKFSREITDQSEEMAVALAALAAIGIEVPA